MVLVAVELKRKHSSLSLKEVGVCPSWEEEQLVYQRLDTAYFVISSMHCHFHVGGGKVVKELASPCIPLHWRTELHTSLQWLFFSFQHGGFTGSLSLTMQSINS